jgi:WD40 repeat protein
MRMPESAWWTAFSHDGQSLYSCGGYPDIWVWDLRTFKLRNRIRTEVKAIHGAALHPTADRIAGGSWDGCVRVWDVAAEAEVLSAERHKKAVSAIRYTAGGALLVSASVDGTVRLTDVATGQRFGKLKRLGSDIHGLTVAPLAKRYGAVHYKGVRVWDEDLRDLFRFDGLYYHGGAGQSDLALPGSGEVLWVTFRSEPHLRAWRLVGCESQSMVSMDLGSPAFRLAFSPDEGLIAVALYREIVLIRAAEGKVVARWAAPNGSERHQDSVCGLSFSPDGRALASCDVTGGLWVWPVKA